MELVRTAWHYLTHFHDKLQEGADYLGPWVYVILFLIIFAETGLVVTPFLPGDSLLFAVGALCGSGILQLGVVLPSLLLAAVLGDAVNYSIGASVGPRVFTSEKSWLFNKSHLEKTQRFYEKYGGKTIIIARFVPIVRTFAPFVAGVGQMRYARFFQFNVIGAVLWVVGLTLLGFALGSIELVKKRFEIVVFAIVFVSILPAIVEILRERAKGRAAAPDKPSAP